MAFLNLFHAWHVDLGDVLGNGGAAKDSALLGGRMKITSHVLGSSGRPGW